MSDNAEKAIEQAIAWHLSSPEMGERDWHDFIAWLEDSADNRREYERLADIDDMLGLLPATRPSAASDKPLASPRRIRWPLWAASAAALMVMALGSYVWTRPALPSQIEQTAAGMVTSMTGVDGTRIDLNGETRLAMDSASPRRAILDKGEALFAVRHASQPFVVEAGGFEIRDLGTVFNVLVTDSALEVSVREGKVLFDPDGANVMLGANEMVTVDRARNLVVKRPTAGVGSWLDGELSFDDSRLSDVVAAMHRRNGIDIRLSSALSGTHFTGNIKLSGDENANAAHLARLIGADYHREGEGWILTADSKPR